jgi:ribose transport system permease protein
VAGPPGSNVTAEPSGHARSRAAAVARRLGLSSIAGSLLFSSRFVTIWIGTGLLVVVCEIIAPQTLTTSSFSSMLPLAAVVGIAALGQMLVVMTGGIDLSIAGTISLMANVIVGASGGHNSRLAVGIFVVLGWSLVIGLINGFMVAILRLNPLIVTLAVGLVLVGITARYRLGEGNAATVPASLSNWVFKKPLFEISWVFWAGIVLTVVVALLLRSTSLGRRFQAVGANPRAAWIAGIHVRTHILSAYAASALAGGIAGILLAGVLVQPDSDPGQPYLFGPVAAVVLAGTSLTGGLSSATSTWVAAFALTLLNQMLRVLGLTSALQFVVFGAAIVVGMVLSGDRIAAILSRVLQRPGMRAFFGDEAGSP